MKVVLNDKALYLIFLIDGAHIDSSLADLKEIIDGISQSLLYRPILQGFLAVKKRLNNKNSVLQSTAMKEDKNHV